MNLMNGAERAHTVAVCNYIHISEDTHRLRISPSGSELSNSYSAVAAWKSKRWSVYSAAQKNSKLDFKRIR